MVGRDCPGQGCGAGRSCFGASRGRNQVLSDPWEEVEREGPRLSTPPPPTYPKHTLSGNEPQETSGAGSPQGRGVAAGPQACWSSEPSGRKGGGDSPSISLSPVQTPTDWAQGEAGEAQGGWPQPLPMKLGPGKHRAKAPGHPHPLSVAAWGQQSPWGSCPKLGGRPLPSPVGCFSVRPQPRGPILQPSDPQENDQHWFPADT